MMTPKVFSCKRLLIEYRFVVFLLVLLALVASIDANFLSGNNLLNVLRQTSVNAIIAVGMTMVILTAGIDLSVGSVLALCGAIAAAMVQQGIPVTLVVVTVLMTGTLLGGASGALVAIGRVQPFIATLIMMTLLRGVVMVFSGGRPITTGFSENAEHFVLIGTGYCSGIPVPVWITGTVFLIGWVVLRQMPIGRYIYGVGGNQAATALSGIPVGRVLMFVYAASGLFAAVAGLIITARLSSAQPTAGMAYELDAIAAVVVGGTSLMGGKGHLFGTLIGALIIGFLNNALNLLDVSAYWQMIAKAVVILAAVLVDNWLAARQAG